MGDAAVSHTGGLGGFPPSQGFASTGELCQVPDSSLSSLRLARMHSLLIWR